MPKRLFIAADIDERTRGQVGEVSKAVRAALDRRVKATWVRADRMHLTLYFFGAADEALERRIVDSLAGPIGGPPFDLAFEGVGFFPERGSPRVLWLGVRLGAAELRRVQAGLVARLPVPAEREAFSPHLTLARLRERVPRAQLTKTADIPSFAGPTRIDRVTLYESRLSPAGPEYVRIAEAPLQP